MFDFRRGAFGPQSDLAIDLGTANTLVIERGAGVIFNEPSICCFRTGGHAPELVAAGSEAQEYCGRVAKPLKVVRPLRNGVLSDMAAARELLAYAVRNRGGGWRLGRPRPIIGVPADATKAERSALATAAVDAGMAEPRLMAEPFLSAIGSELDVAEPRGRMVVDCGAGTTEVAVISLGGICVSHSARGGSDGLDQALVDHLHLKHRFHIGAATAERLKRRLSALLDQAKPDDQVTVRGLDSARGLPATIELPIAELMKIWRRYADGIVDVVRDALGGTAPELAHDILEDGITLTGGGSLTARLAAHVAEATGIATRAAQSPLESVARGLAAMLDQRMAIPAH
jgi:rod shape-determining protein MreB